MEFPKMLYSPKTFFTLGGASVGVYLATSVAGHVFQFNPRWLGLVLAEFVALAGATQVANKERGNRLVFWTVAVFNGILIYSQAVGINALNSAIPTGDKGVSAAGILPFDTVAWFVPAEQTSRIENLQTSKAKLRKANEEISRDAEKLLGKITITNESLDNFAHELQKTPNIQIPKLIRDMRAEVNAHLEQLTAERVGLEKTMAANNDPAERRFMEAEMRGIKEREVVVNKRVEALHEAASAVKVSGSSMQQQLEELQGLKVQMQQAADQLKESLTNNAGFTADEPD